MTDCHPEKDYARG